MIVAAEGPKRTTVAKTNVSETESLAGILGIRTVNDPLRSVKPASRNQRKSTTLIESVYRECRTTTIPAVATPKT